MAVRLKTAQWRKRSPQFDNAVLRGLPVEKESRAGVRPVVGACFSRVQPTPIEDPELVVIAPDALRLVGIEVTASGENAPVVPGEELVHVDELAPFLAGNELFDGSETAAQCYCGHQFGYFSGQLGDGAAIYLGEVLSGSQRERWEMQLKGAGLTPFSRSADGRKVLRSTLREFLASEHMHALGIPTTRAGSVVTSRKTTVLRDQFYDGNAREEPTAVVLRVARTFLRFGSFEIFKDTDARSGRAGPSANLPYKKAMMRQMVNFTIRQYFPDIWQASEETGGDEGETTRIREFFAEVVRRTAVLVAKWQSVGFCHGVLNTDNMSIIGDTLDYGPFGFMEHFDPQHICNTSDDGGRYRYEAQPEICKWNCSVLADQLALIVDPAELEPALARFDEWYGREYYRLMRQKLGLLHKFLPREDKALIDDLFNVLAETGADFTCTFRSLAELKPYSTDSAAAVVNELVKVSETLEQVKRRHSTFTDSQYQMVVMLLEKNPAQARMYGVTQEMREAMERERAVRAELDRTSDAHRRAHLREAWSRWVDAYAKRLKEETDGVPDAAHEMHRRDEMRRVNPVFVLRNHVAQRAIDFAADGDYDAVAHILHLLKHPFDESNMASDRVAMDTIRSEISDESLLSSSRYTASGASFVGSITSSRSTARSDYLSNYENKFLQRKAVEKKKKRAERERRKAIDDSLTADDKRRADREAERQARKAEMATWLPTPETLQRIEREAERRKKERLEQVLGWYPPIVEDDKGRSTRPSNNNRTHEATPTREIHAVFSEQSRLARAGSEHERRAAVELESEAKALQRKMLTLQQKMVYVENRGNASVSATWKANSQRRRRPRVQVRATLAPLGSSQSATAIPTLHNHAASLTRSTSVFFFRDTRQEAEAAVVAEHAEVEGFLAAHRRQHKRHRMATIIQATWRMHRRRRVFLRWRRRRTKHRRKFFQVWAMSFRLLRQARRSLKRKCLRAWKTEVEDAIELRRIELQIFRSAETAVELPRLVMNLVFTSSDYDDAFTRKVLTYPTRAYFTGFVNAAFASVEQHDDDNTPGANNSDDDDDDDDGDDDDDHSRAARRQRAKGNRVRRLKAQHLELRRSLAKKIVQRTFRAWQRLHEKQRRIGLNAQLCIKRAARLAFGARPVWPAERMLIIFETWARYAAFRRSKRLGGPMPHFASALPSWDLWLHNYQERQIRKVKAASRAPIARLKRCFRCFRAVARVAKRRRLAEQTAVRHAHFKLQRAVMHEWYAAIADSAARTKLCRSVLRGWASVAATKRRLRPRRLAVVTARTRREHTRAWAAWRSVLLRSRFKRELNRARLEQTPWRSQVQRVLWFWMDVRAPRRKWTCFVAWRQLVQRRRLFLTIRTRCDALRRRHLLLAVLTAWRAVVWKQESDVGLFLEDRLSLTAWDAYDALSTDFPMLFMGCYSNAAAVFGGVPLDHAAQPNDPASPPTAPTQTQTQTPTPKPATPNTSTVLRHHQQQQKQRDIQRFHAELTHCSVADARRVVWSSLHLVNQTDDATGNTALHVAAQLEDPVRRVDVLRVLLSEGAVTWDRVNRHGLTPLQLTPPDDAAARVLLARGVYESFARDVQAAPPPTDSRVLWCLVTLLSSEYVRGERLAGDLRREWHSVLRQDLWLRQGRIYLASDSEFSPAILRCRAFLNGMKRRVCRSKDDALLDQLRRTTATEARPVAPGTMLLKSSARRMLSRDLSRMEEKLDLLSWLSNTTEQLSSAGDSVAHRDEDAREALHRATIAALGQYGAYGEWLLSPTLQDEFVESTLVHSFVGVLYSLELPLEDVISEATRLEAECDALEDDVLHQYQAILQGELRLHSPERPTGLPLLRFFSEASDAELFFKHELLLVNTALWQSQPLDDLHARERRRQTLLTEIDLVRVKAQRKLRKVDKKATAAEQRLAELELTLSEILVADLPPSRRLREICDARQRVEAQRLRIANLRLKQLDLGDKVSGMENMRKQLEETPLKTMANGSGGGAIDDGVVLEEECEDEDATAPATDDAGAVASLELKRQFLESELASYLLVFRSQATRASGSFRASPNVESVASGGNLRRLHKQATASIRTLFLTNLFRCCCCWLAENMIPRDSKAASASSEIEEHAGETGDAAQNAVPDSQQQQEEHQRRRPQDEGDACADDIGNFVMSGPSLLALPPTASEASSPGRGIQSPAIPTMETLWKRGSMGSIDPRRAKELPGSAGAGSGGSSFDLFASAEDELAFNASFRAISSASKDRRNTDLELEGVRITRPVQGVQQRPTSTVATDEPEPSFSRESREGIWQDFTSSELSPAVQDAYAELYPRLYEPRTPGVATRPSTSIQDWGRESSYDPEELPVEQQVERNRRFWSAVEGYKALASPMSLDMLALDEKTAYRRRQDRAVSIFHQFLQNNASSRLPWLHMYQHAVRDVQQSLLRAPVGLFDPTPESLLIHSKFPSLEERAMALQLNDLFSVAGKVVVITGGGRGIGKMMAEGFVKNHATVYIASRSLAACEETAKELNALGAGKCIPLQANLSSEEVCKAFADELAKREKKVDVLINNSGVVWGGDIDNHPGHAWDRVLNVNVKSPFFLTRDLLPLLDEAAKTEDGARVINVGSIAGFMPQNIPALAYDTSKAAVHHLTRVLAAKLARRPNGGHILVNAIAPGLVPTKMTEGIALVTGSSMDDLAQFIPLQRYGHAHDMAGLAIFLSSRASSWITGMVICSDGGQIGAVEAVVGSKL
ncbi:hypothetical protein ATCC90586_006553 [Pythium insidiosum]|nr:hypothetical protein ATCC90586_006553 [Pythium insidiosum]